MINTEEVKQAITDRIIASNIVPVGDIAWQNIVFNPAKKDLWLGVQFLDAGETPATFSRNQLDGIYQVSVNININDRQGESKATSTAVQLGNLFTAFEVLETDNYRTSFKPPSRSFEGKLDDSWYTVVIDFNITIYEK